jgi:hypothetical protein
LSVGRQGTFQRNRQPPSSRPKNKPRKKQCGAGSKEDILNMDNEQISFGRPRI